MTDDSPGGPPPPQPGTARRPLAGDQGTHAREQPAIQPTFAGQAQRPKSTLPGLIGFALVLAGLAYGAVYVIQQSGKRGYAEVIFLRGEARVGDQLVKLGDRLPPNQSVELGDGARCFLQLPSGLVLKLSSQARLRLGAKEGAQMTLEAGALEVEQKPGTEDLLPDAPTQRIAVPGGKTINTKSRRFEVTVDRGGKRSILAVFDGAARVASEGGESVSVARGEGSVIERAGAARKISLPLPPKITRPAAGAQLPTVIPEVAVEPVEGAVAYVWEARTADGFETLYQVEVADAAAALPRLPRDGGFRLTVRAVLEVEGARVVGLLSDPRLVQVTVYAKANRLRGLAHNFRLNGKHAEAEAHAAQALALWPGDPKMLRVRAQALVQLGRVDEGAEVARALKASDEAGAADELAELLHELAGSPHGQDPRIVELGNR